MANFEDSHQPLRPEDELQFIRKIIAQSRAEICEDGNPYIVWGLIVAIGMAITYISALLERNMYTGFLWIGLVLAGYIYIFSYSRKKRRREPRVKSILGRIQGAIWGACGGTIGLLILLIIGNSMLLHDWSVRPLLISSLVSLILGIAYFLSGVVNDLKWLRNIGFVWWTGAVIMFYWQSVHVLGLFALMMLLFQVVPGIILNRKYRAEASQREPEA